MTRPVTSPCVRGDIGAPVGTVFDLVAHPGEQHRFDASMMVGQAVTRKRLANVGDICGALLGWRWRYDLEPDGARRTRASLTYDWGGTSEENLRRARARWA